MPPLLNCPDGTMEEEKEESEDGVECTVVLPKKYDAICRTRLERPSRLDHEVRRDRLQTNSEVTAADPSGATIDFKPTSRRDRANNEAT